MTTIIAFHLPCSRTFKVYFTRQFLRHLAWAFPRLVSYKRFVGLMPGALLPLAALLQARRGRCRQSMSRRGHCWDNAASESFFGVMKLSPSTLSASPCGKRRRTSPLTTSESFTS